MNFRKLAILIAAGCAAASSAAAGDFSGKIGLASQYLGKGLGKSDEEPALSGSVRYTTDSGLYADAFISQAASSRGANAEVILVTGYEAETAGFAFDTQLMYREMLGETNGVDSGYWELQADASRKFGKLFSTRLRVNYSPDTYSSGDEAWWVEAQAGLKAGDNGQVSAAYAVRRIEGGTDYDAWNIGYRHKFTKAFAGDLRWYDTDGHSYGERYEGRLVAALTYSF